MPELPTESTPIEIYLIDDNDRFRKSVRALFENTGMTLFDFSSADEFLEQLSGQPKKQVRQCVRQCIVTDIHMPGMSGLQLIRQLQIKKVRLPVIVVSGSADVPTAVACMREGASNFIEKPFDPNQLIQQIHAAIEDPGAVLRNPDASRQKLRTLTPREKQVFSHVCEGRLNKTTADILGISVKTVELHRAKVISKLGVRSIQELVKLNLGY
ncbi:MAG: DNA-binding response regulator [Gammaproteobacteria bacterium]|nr:MAG: DNA-binding response regulator [Pseudomonadota bacterium]PIE38873.1 MAG: DNA-binding response regulator [Gammaproteobacteria bacterium]